MKFAISNIAWPKEWDSTIYDEMQRLGIYGLEIAPTRIFGDHPYNELSKVKNWYEGIKRQFVIPSMQSIWYGVDENIFNSKKDRDYLFDHTKKAIDLANMISCKNLVFGCPRNRNGVGDKRNIALSFFKEIGVYAASKNTCIGIEAIPKCYNTDFLNTTQEALEFVKEIDHKGIRLNFDLGTLITNCEDLSIIENNADMISHVHISDPGLNKICKRKIHFDLINILNKHDYKGFVSVEMKKQDEIKNVIEILEYLSEL